MDWLDLLAVQGTLKSLLQHHSSKASILLCSAFFIVQLSHPYKTTGKTVAFTRRTFVVKVMSLLFNMLSRLVIIFLPSSKLQLSPGTAEKLKKQIKYSKRQVHMKEGQPRIKQPVKIKMIHQSGRYTEWRQCNGDSPTFGYKYKKVLERERFAEKRVLHHPCEHFVYFNSRGDLSSLMPDNDQNTEIT